MDEELKPASEEEQTTPEAAEVQPEMVPVSDLRKVQGVKDRELAVKDREVTAATTRAQMAEQRLAALEASMEQLATQTMGADEAQAFIGERRQQSQMADLQRRATEGQKFRDILEMARKNSVPISEFEAVIANSGATYIDAQQVVSGFYQKQLDDLKRQQATAEAEAATVARKVERQVRNEDGSDAIGAPAEPTTGSPDLEAQFEKEKQQIIARALAGQRGQDSALLALKHKYHKLGLASLQ